MSTKDVIAKLSDGQKVVARETEEGEVIIVGDAPKDAVHDVTIGEDVEIIKGEDDGETPSPPPSIAQGPSVEPPSDGQTIFENNTILIIFLCVLVYVQYKLKIVSRLENNNELLSAPSIIALGILIEHTVVHNIHLIKLPEQIVKVLRNDISKLLVVLILTYITTKDLVSSILITFSFLSLIQIFRSPEEKRRHPYLI